MFVLYHVCVEGLVFHSNISEHCDVIETTALGHLEDIPRVIAEGLDRARSLPELRATYTSAAGFSSGTSGDGGNSSGVGASSSYPRIAR